MQTATAAGNPHVDGDVERTAANIAGGFPAGESSWLKTVSILRKWPSWPLSQNQIDVEQIGITSALRLARAETDARALGVEHG